MNRLTRSLNSPESRRFITPLRLNPTVRSLAGISSTTTTLIKPTRTQFLSTNVKNYRTSFTIASGRSKADSLSTAMDPDASCTADIYAPAAGGDFVSFDDLASPVHQDHNADIKNLVQSISSVDGDRGEERGHIDAEAGGDTRKELPEELSRSVIKLSCESSAEGGISDVYLVGTAHVSKESCQEVQAVISFLKPQVVFLELCASRVAILTPQNMKVPTMGQMVDKWKKKNNVFGILYCWFLAKVASKLEVFPGSEFRVAFEEAKKYGGKVVLGDRPVQITLRRTWARMPLWQKTKLLYSLTFQSFFLPSAGVLKKMLKDIDDVDMMTLMIQEMSKKFPTLMETLVYERDRYMSSTLLRVASEHSSVVAVVGKGHLQGIKKYWKQPIGVKDLMDLDVPSDKPAISAVKILKTLGVAVAGLAIVSGVYLSGKK